MIYDALIVPHERPPSLTEIKRALITYDKVILVDPEDRELIPRNSFLQASIGVPLMGIDTGPVRPLGKCPDYDRQFSKLVDECADAIDQGLLEVRSTYRVEETTKSTIGAVPKGGFPVSVNFVLGVYRHMASAESLLRSAISEDSVSFTAHFDFWESAALEGQADSRVNNGPALPVLDVPSRNVEQAQAFTLIARGRIGALVKYCSFCEAKTLMPILNSAAYGDLTANVLRNARAALLEATANNPTLARSRVLELCHEEFLEDAKLETMPLKSVVALRSKAWGKQAAARERLFQSVFELAAEVEADPVFYEKVGQRISEYRKESDAVVRERANLRFRATCEIGKTIGVAGGAGVISQFESPLGSIASTLVAGGILALAKLKEFGPDFQKMRGAEREMKRGACFGLHNFYSRLPKQV